MALLRSAGGGRRLVAVGAVGAVGAVVACAALAVPAVVHAVSDPPSHSTASHSSAGSGRQPAREPTSREKSLLFTADQILLRDCMARHGFVYLPVKENPVPDAREFPYVIDDVAWAREHGYGSDIQRALAQVRATDPNQLYFRALPSGRRAAALKAANGERMEGVTAKAPDGMVAQRSSGGCQSEADRTLYGNLQEWFQAEFTEDSLTGMRQSDVNGDPRFAEAVKPWAACMRKAGHPYPSPARLRAQLPAPEHPLPRTEEVRLAVAEARCAISSGLARTADELDRQYADKLRRQHRSAVETRLRLQHAALPRARAVTSAAGTDS